MYIPLYSDIYILKLIVHINSRGQLTEVYPPACKVNIAFLSRVLNWVIFEHG